MPPMRDRLDDGDSVTSRSRGERRRAVRHRESVQVSLAITQPVTLSGVTVDRSSSGVLLHTHGRIPILLSLQGKQYRGWLTRASRADEETLAIAVALEELVRLEDVP